MNEKPACLTCGKTQCSDPYYGEPGTDEGRKFDKDKPRWELLPLGPVEAIVQVLTHGAKKYDDFNWQKLDNLHDRYFAAMMRHLKKTRDGEVLDMETGLSHLAHALCCGIFLLWKEQQEKEA